MRTVLLAIAMLCSLAAALLKVADVPRAIFHGGFVVVAVVFVVLIGVRIRRASADDSAMSGVRSVNQMARQSGAYGTSGHGVSVAVDRDAGYTLSLHDALPIYRKSVV